MPQRLESPYKLFTDATGRPLESGYIYFGVAGQNPANAPITVYWDAAGTIPAAQPLRTVNGYIVNNGSPANVYCNGNYSQEVRDRNGVTIFLDLNRAGNPDGFLTAITAGMVTGALGYTPANSTNPYIAGGAEVSSMGTDFNAFKQNALTTSNTGGSEQAAMVQYERVGIYGIKAGIDRNNSFVIGGWSQGNAVPRVYWDMAGNQVTLGNVTAYSDERFKTEIEPIGQSVARTLKMRGITYLDRNTAQWKIGAIAQEVMRAGFPEAVNTDDQGFLSLAYGQLALALVIENTRELHARIAALEAQINEQKG